MKAAILFCAAGASLLAILRARMSPLPKRTHILLVDNGSLRAESFLSLRAMASAVSAATGVAVVAASARFADRVAAAELGGTPGDTLATAVARALGGPPARHHVLILPAFLGPADTLRALVPEFFSKQRGVTHAIAAPLVTGPGDARVAQALLANLEEAFATHGLEPKDAAVVVCDHGSPHADVAAVRGYVASHLARQLAAHPTLATLRAPLAQASMERRDGPDYAFNDPLLASLLRTPPFNEGNVVLGLLFLSPGAHAGVGGDIDEICAEAVAEAAQAGRALRVFRSPLLGPRVTDILADRLREVMPSP